MYQCTSGTVAVKILRSKVGCITLMSLSVLAKYTKSLLYVSLNAYRDFENSTFIFYKQIEI